MIKIGSIISEITSLKQAQKCSSYNDSIGEKQADGAYNRKIQPSPIL